ncbi:hypothetical protein C0991_004929 [Blastosporella zonata]|nr:hypothetical protein C0991_004929 [Blastosporella zonata]
MVSLLVHSAADLNSRVEPLIAKFSQPETEDSWEIIAKNLKSFADLCLNGGACEFPTELITILRSSARPINNSLVTERTRLSSVAIDLISTVASGLGTSFKPLLHIFFPTLISLCGRTNKVVITRSRACIITVIETTQLPLILSYFSQVIDDKSSSIRFTAADGTLTCVNCFNPPDLEKDARASEIEAIIRAAAKDSQADIRVVGRKLFEAYKLVLPTRIDSFTSPLSPTTKKYLDIKAISNAGMEESHPVLPNTKNKFSSSTSAIASTRGRPEATHARSVSSSTIPTDRRTSHTTTKAPTTTVRQKTEMPPPMFVPIRPPTRQVSVSRSTSAAESRPRVVSTTLSSRAESTTATSDHCKKIPPRPNSATSHNDAPHRLRPQQLVPTLSGPSGPRRVPISEAAPKTVETTTKPTARSRVASAASATSQIDDKAPPTRAPQQVAPIREKPKPIPKGREARPAVQTRPTTSINNTKPKASGVTQPTLSQMSRVKATADRKQPNTSAPKQLWGRPAASKVVPSSTSTTEKGKFKPTRITGTGVKKTIQPATVPLPPSPTLSIQSGAPIEEELAALCLTKPDENQAITATHIVHEEAVCTPEELGPSLVIVHAEDEPETDIMTTQGGDEIATAPHVASESGDDTGPEGPTTPTVISVDTIFDTSAKTPISSLLSSIQRGFLLTPCSPLSPPQSYLDRAVEKPIIPFPLAIDGSGTEQEKAPQGLKPFMFGLVGEEYGRSMLGNVENLNIDK